MYLTGSRNRVESARRLIAHAVGAEDRDPLSHQDELAGYMTLFPAVFSKGNYECWYCGRLALII